MLTFTVSCVKCHNSHLVSADGLRRRIFARTTTVCGEVKQHTEHKMIVKAVVLLACHSLVPIVTDAYDDVVHKTFGPALSGSARVRSDIVMYKPRGDDALTGEFDLLARKNMVTCTRSGLQCASDGMTLVECSDTLNAVSAWDCERIFPKHLFMDADAVEILCDPFRGSCSALIQVMDLEDNRPDMEHVVDSILESALQRGSTEENNFPKNDVDFSSGYNTPAVKDTISKTMVYNNSNENNISSTDKVTSLPQVSDNVNGPQMKHNDLETSTEDSPTKLNVPIEVQGNGSSLLLNSSAGVSAETVASLPYVKCSKQGLHCADTTTIIHCDNGSSEPLFELSCSSMLQSSEVDSGSGKCDDATASCLLNLGGFPLRMRVFQSSEKIEGVCQDGTLTCADNSTLVACSGDSSIPSYAINCAGEESNDVFSSYCDSEQKGCVIKRKESNIAEIGAEEIVNDSSAALTTPGTSKTKSPSSIVAIPSMFLIPPLIPLSESIGTTTEEHTTVGVAELCQSAGWKCADSSTLILCSTLAVDPMVQLQCNTTDHPYCNVMTGLCILGDNTVTQSPCLHPGLQCISDHVLGWCSSGLQVRRAVPCEAVCDKATHSCGEPLSEKPTVPATSTTASHTQPLLGSCSKPGMQCIGTDMLGSCDSDLTLSYVVPCNKLLPYADISSVAVFCDKQIDACAISQVLDKFRV